VRELNEPAIVKETKRRQVESMKRRRFSAELKAKIVLEVIRGEKELNQIASEYEIAPNQIRNWKNEFLKNAAAAFDDNRTEDLKAILQEKERESDSLYKKVGQLTTQVDWLKKKSEELLGPEWESKFTPRPKGQ